MTFKLKDNANIKLNGKSTAQSSDLNQGQSVVITYKYEDGSNTASSISEKSSSSQSDSSSSSSQSSSGTR
jgi:hypothetical protein